MTLPRKKTFVVFKEADKLGPYDERPMLPDDVHLQICLSRNDHTQPFHLICDHDTLIAVFSGTGKVEFKQSGVKSFPLSPGDHVYVPAGAPTRVVPETECVIMRYKTREPGLEGVAWFCESCDGELFRYVFDTRQTFPQEGYLAATQVFNADERRRRCEACDVEHPPIDLKPYRWSQLAAQLRE